MPTASASVEVQAPPGLEAVSGCRLPMSDPGVIGTPKAGVQGGADVSPAMQKSEAVKDELVREVTEAVREHIEWSTATAVDQLWTRGQKAMTHLAMQQATQTEHLQGQLAACADSYRQLERENAALRSSLEALMKHLTMVFGGPSHPGMMPQHAQFSPFYNKAGWEPPKVPGGSREAAEAPRPPKGEAQKPPSPTMNWLGGLEAMPTGPSPALPPSSVSAPPATAPPPPPAATTPESTTPPLPTVAEDDDEDGLPTIPVPLETMTEAAALLESAASGGTGSDPSSPSRPLLRHGSLPAVPETSAAVALPPTFKLTLRRADNVPLGLEIRCAEDGKCLIVEAVRPGGAVEAWNRQCAGDMREIRTGDLVVRINDSEDAEGMRQECLEKHLLRMTVMCGSGRGAGAPQQSALSASAPLTVSQQSLGLRADAVEFVPGSL